MLPVYFAAEAATEHAEEGLPLGLSLEAFLIQLVTFVLIFFLLKRFAFTPIVNMLDKRHKVIEVIREARHDADRIIGDAQKEGREMVREAEKVAHKKSELMLADAEARINEEAEQARRRVEKDIAGLVSEATEAVVEEKVDAKKDADLIDRAIKKGRKKS
jgi:F-type H+-transporting ATPase subunit b